MQGRPHNTVRLRLNNGSPLGNSKSNSPRLKLGMLLVIFFSWLILMYIRVEKCRKTCFYVSVSGEEMFASLKKLNIQSLAPGVGADNTANRK